MCIRVKNWRTNLWGALGTLGTALIAAPVLLHMAGDEMEVPLWMKKTCLVTALVGFLLSGFSKCLAALFSADAKTVEQLRQEVKGTEEFYKQKLTNPS